MTGYINFEFFLNGELYELTTEYDESMLSETDIDLYDDGMTVYNLITYAQEVTVKGKDIDGDDLEEMLDEKAVVTGLLFNDHELYEEYSEQVAVDNFIEHKESVVIW